jgi:hypothetical protein
MERDPNTPADPASEPDDPDARRAFYDDALELWIAAGST